MPKLVIDPGHGAPDPGAVGQNGLQEADVALSIALKVKQLLSISNIEVILTRDENKRPGTTASNSLTMRALLANNNKADAFISIHCNSATNRNARGTMTFIDADGGRAKTLAEDLSKALSIELPDMNNNGVKVAKDFLKHNLYVLHNTNMPAALIELGFISNEEDEKWLRQEDTQYRAARAISKAVAEYFGEVPILKDEQDLIDLSNPSEWAKDGWKWATDNHLLDGTRPHDTVTREELAVILQRFFVMVK